MIIGLLLYWIEINNAKIKGNRQVKIKFLPKNHSEKLYNFIKYLLGRKLYNIIMMEYFLCN